MIIEQLKLHKIVAILRGLESGDAIQTVQAMFDGGIRLIEVTFNTKGAPQMIDQIKETFGDRMIIGAGTVLDAPTAKTAISAGADFLLSPILDTGMIETCNRYGKTPIPGVMTPTEIVRAYEAGAKMVKIFPAAALGADYFKQVKAPLDFIEMMAVGGVSRENMHTFFKAGACCVGIGGQLLNMEHVREKRFDAITENALSFTNKPEDMYIPRSCSRMRTAHA